MRYQEALGERDEFGARDERAGLTARQVRLAALRARVRRVERPAGVGRRVALGWVGGRAGGWAAVDAALAGDDGRGGLAVGALHEVFSGGGSSGSAAGSAAASAVGERFVLRVLARLSGPVLWCHSVRRGAALYGPGIAQMGGNLAERLRIARVGSGSDGLWVAEEALRSGALSAVVLEPMQAIDLTASRRLQLAAEAGGTLGIILNDAPGGGVSGGGVSGGLTPSVAMTRWQVAALPSDTAGDGVRRRWQLSLLRCRGGETGAWEVEDDTA